MAPHVCVLLRWIGLTLFDQRLVHVASKQISIGVLGGQAVLSPKAMESKGNGEKKVGKEWEEPGFGAAGKNAGASLAVSDKALKKDLKAVRPGYRYLLGELYTNIFLPFIAIRLLFELQRSKLSSSKHTWT